MFDKREQVSLAPYTTFSIGGTARYFLTVANKNDLGAALDFAMVKELPTLLLGGGSNILVSDDGFNGVVIHITFNNMNISTTSSTVEADAGIALSTAVYTSVEHRLAGMERLYGIPGTIGGALRGNAGAFGMAIQDVVQEVTVLDSTTRDIKIFSKEECNFSYRNSIFKQNDKLVILSAKFQLRLEEHEQARAKAIATLALRNERQIQDIQSAGSFFENPRVPKEVQQIFYEEKGIHAHNERVPAGWLIEKAGFKNKCVHYACTGKRSANYIINKKEASAQDVRTLMLQIQKAVYTQFGVLLKTEVVQVGFEEVEDEMLYY